MKKISILFVTCIIIWLVLPSQTLFANSASSEESRQSSRQSNGSNPNEDMDKLNSQYAEQLKKWKSQMAPTDKLNKPIKPFSIGSKVISTMNPRSIPSTDIYKFQSKYMTNNFSSDMSSSTVTNDEHTLITKGNFRTTKDLSGMAWEVEDKYSPSSLKYPTQPDFTDVNLSYNYNITGYTPTLDSGAAPILTVETNDGQYYYVRLWNYVVNRPTDNWETSTGTTFPQHRVAGQADGATGSIQIDFNNLYAGWTPYVWSSVPLLDANGQPMKYGDGVPMMVDKWSPNPDWVKVPVNNIKKIMWSYAPLNYDYNSASPYLKNSEEFTITMSNWNVTGNTFLMRDPITSPQTSLRMTDDYDDTYNLTPERIVSDYSKLGYTGTVSNYIGTTRYYDRKYNGTHMEIIQDHPFNAAFESWYSNYCQNLQRNHYKLINSISMENVNAPETWWQRTWNNTPVTSGWDPTPYLLSFTNAEVKNYYKSLVEGLGRIASTNNLEPIVQLGEPAWWTADSNSISSPAFYDQSTRQLYQQESGESMYEYKSSHDPIEGHEKMLNWLRDKNGEFSLYLKNALKAKFANAKFTVLLYTPAIMDKEKTPPMMGIVNFPKEQWKYPNLDFVMFEDYDYIIDNRMDQHLQTLDLIQSNLNYPSNKIHYITGFVKDPNKSEIWNRMNQAINDGFNKKFGEVYAWSYTQIKRDSWKQPSLIMASSPSGTYNTAFNLSFSSVDSDEIKYTLDGSAPESGTVFISPITIAKNVTVKVAALKLGKVISSYTFMYGYGSKQNYKYTYDAAGRLLTIQYTLNNKNYTMNYTYDSQGNQLQSKITIN
ncbi:hypothetical protein J2Z69_000115 [Paenibacillus shirakamiensis]|uniref:YD repeat-containing protein n=1 Tax=Paenibacillus shirakamiensis TaxID=1265935 RepID=A0ABS4JDA9_9BACL|nr:chitobiase/beta-hexosaminidase C-terminal domain-containing protein [Paenibacillus shirakamiensis]MBP1999096.1 hypothetical protein [Paenibacillus shirakamiensis]